MTPTKFGYIALVGRPSAGKSTLLNTLCGAKVSITANSPQTTRNKIRGILNCKEGQLVFLDTPGYHHAQKILNRRLVSLIRSSLSDADAVLYVTDVTRPPGREESHLISLVKERSLPVVVALNKIDAHGRFLSSLRTLLSEELSPVAIMATSALHGEGKGPLTEALFSLVPEGPLLYPSDVYTDQNPLFRISEIIREEALGFLTEELPHAFYVDIIDTKQKKKLLWVRALLYVEQESQKGILVGQGGQRIRAIRVGAEASLSRLFPQKVKLDLRVKTHPKWRKKETLLHRLFH